MWAVYIDAVRTHLPALRRQNSPIVKAYLLKEDLRRFWDYRRTAWAAGHLRQWLWRAFGYRTSWAYIANIYRCCARLPLPRHFLDRSRFSLQFDNRCVALAAGSLHQSR